MHLYKIRKAIIRNIYSIVNIIWFGPLGSRKIHLVNLDKIANRFSVGGWGIKRTKFFGWHYCRIVYGSYFRALVSSMRLLLENI